MINHPQVDVSKLRYFYVEDDCGSAFTTPMHRELRAAQGRVVDHFRKAYKLKVTKVRSKSTSEKMVYILRFYAKIKSEKWLISYF